MFILPSEEIVYFVAKVVVIYDSETKQQRFYAEHTDEIRCISQHPNSWIFATGQVSGGSNETLDHARIWDSKALVTMNILNFDELDLSIECLTFSQVISVDDIKTKTTLKELPMKFRLS